MPKDEYTDAEFEDLRRGFDRKWNKSCRRLERCYYGSLAEKRPELIPIFGTWKNGRRIKNGWYHGVTHEFVAKRGPSNRPILKFDFKDGKAYRIKREPGPVWVETELPNKDAKKLFDDLHGQLWDDYEIAFQEHNDTLGSAGRSKEYAKIRERDRQYDDEGVELPTRISDDKKVTKTSRKSEGIELEVFEDEE